MNDQNESHVFISYVKEDKDTVLRLRDALKVYGINVWIDRDRIRPGERWEDTIRHAIQTGTYFLACFSDAYNERNRTYMNEELILAIEELRKRPSSREWFIPVLLSECDVPDRKIGGGETLNAIHRVSIYEDWHDGIRRILSVIAPNSSKIYQLINQMKSKSARNRVKAADDLGMIGPLSKAAVPVLIHALKDEHETVRGVAAWALGMIGLATKEVIFALLQYHKDPYSIHHSSEAILMLGKTVVPVITEALKDHKNHVRCNAAHALGKFGSEARAALPALIEALKDEDSDVRWPAAHALGEIGSKDAVLALIEALKDEDSFVRCSVAHALGEIGSKDAVLALIEALKDEDSRLRSYAARALGEISAPEARKAIEEYKKNYN